MNEYRPESEDELADIVRRAAVEGRGLRVIGGGTRALGHDVDGDPLRTEGLAGIRLYEPGALTLVAGAGTPLAEVEAALAAEGQRLPFEPWDGRALYGTGGGTAGEPTIGGVVAPRHARNVEEVLSRAHEALNAAKSKRRGSFQAYRPNIEREEQRFKTGAPWSGALMSVSAYGHTGFTGTSIGIDPERDLFVILLSNRVNPTRNNPRITAVR